jgi:predicted ArsR family transcriptional regulator
MHSTKTEILALLKRNDGSTVDDLASALHLAPMTVRQHLTALERDLLVRAEEVRRQTGRPHHLYRLTVDGHRSTIDGHDRMLALLVEQVGLLEPADVAGLTPAERRAGLFRNAAITLAGRHRSDVRALVGNDRIERVVEILRSHGGFPEFHDLGDTWEVRDFACVYRATVGGSGACDWHETFLSSVFNVQIQAADSPAVCADCCRYFIPVMAPAPARNEATTHGRY